MSAWSEDDFLERLMARSRQESKARVDGCPDSESLCAFADGRVRGVVRDAIVAHLTECSACSELNRRLMAFANSLLAESDREWQGVEKRLDNWLDAYLEAHKAAPSQSHLGITAGGWNWWASLKSHWALGAVAAIVVLGITSILIRHDFSTRHHIQTAVVTVPPPAPTGTKTSVSAVAAEPHRSTSVAAQHPTKGTTEEAPMPMAQPSEAVDAKTAEEVASSGSLAESSQALPQPQAPLTPPVNNLRSTAGAQPKSGSVGLGFSGSRGVVSSFRPSTAPQVPSAAEEPNVDVDRSLPPSVRLTAGTRLWIRIGFLARKSDGSLSFQGTLIEPVAQAYPLPLDRGAQVEGVETDKQGGTSLVLTAFVIHGIRYALKGPTSEIKGQAGTGVTVPFDNRQVLETFIERDSVYDKAPEATGGR
ncbi:MAG TPA: hypothetical protein VEJ46_00890 [Candidatus Acidoferrum sp.]|nr:hypothetical protein [Candidatus Acidoferrum sp.]